MNAAYTNTPVTTTAFAVGASLLAPIFQGGRLRANVQLTEERQLELVENYRKTILVALQEVEDALAAIRGSMQRVTDLTTAFEEARNAFRLLRVQYEAGAIDFSTLLDAQRTANDAELAYPRNRQARLAASVDLMKSLGGGWKDAKLLENP